MLSLGVAGEQRADTVTSLPRSPGSGAVGTELRGPLQERPYNPWDRLRIIAACGIAVGAIDHLKGYRVALIKMQRIRLHSAHRRSDDHRAFCQEVAGNPARARVASHRTGAASPGR